METTWRDLRTALRNLRRNPVFTAVAVIILALGIGANVAMFSVLHSVVLRPLPYHEPDRLVRLWPAENFNITLVDLVSEGMPAVQAASGLSLWRFTFSGEGEPEQLDAAYVGTNHFELLGVRPMLGRSFYPEERDPGRSDVAILSYDFWQRRFGGDPAVVGRRLPIEATDHRTREVIGVMPPDYRELRGEPDVWAPMALPPGRTFVADSTWWVNWVVGRLAPGASLAQANEQIQTVARRLKEDYPRFFAEEDVSGADVRPLHEDVTGEVAGTLWLLVGAVGLVLLIACANLANLLLARAVGRRRETAVRAALGATRRRLIRQQLTDSLVLTLLGGVAAVPLAWAVLGYLKAHAPAELPRSDSITIDVKVLLFALGVSVLSAVAVGLVPALRASEGRIQDRLRAGGRWQSSGGGHRVNRALVALEVALAMVLVTAGSLVVKGFAGLRTTDPGFRPDGVTVVEAVLPTGRASNAEAVATYFGEALERVRRLPGVETAGAIHLLPLTPDNWAFPYLAEGHAPDPDRPLPTANFRLVAGDYFRTVGIPLVEGRTLTDADRSGAPPVGLINRALADELWPGEDPIGKEIRIFQSIPFTVVGVVGDVRQYQLDRKPLPEMYLPSGQWRWAVGRMFLVLRSSGAPPSARALREVLWAVDPGVPIPSVRPLTSVVAASVADARFFASLLAGFGLLALALGALGVYGVAAHVTRARTADYGIRLALGAKPAALVRLIVADGLRPVAIGLGLGLAGSLLTGRLLSGLLYGVAPTDPSVYGLVTSVLVSAGLLATWLPARRAGRLDPVEILRSE
jgi:putative ABC transport system permease protein